VAILRELARWREQAARRCDTPPRSYLKDEILVDLAKTPVKEVGGLARVRGLPRPVEQQEGSAIVEATRKGLATPAADLPVMEKPEECAGERFTVDSLWSAVQAWCYGNAVDPTLATSRQEVARFYREIRHSGGESGELRLSAGWRNELLGSMLREFLAGRRSFACAGTGRCARSSAAAVALRAKGGSSSHQADDRRPRARSYYAFCKPSCASINCTFEM
jgi:ribonuclease D